MKRLLQALFAAFLVLPALGIFGGRALADAPTQQGWWWQGNPGAIPEAGVNPSRPPPDVPAKGLLIEGGTGSAIGAGDGGPTAFAALLYQLPQGDSASTLTLSVASGSATTPSVTLELCPLDNPGLNAEQGGPLADAPTYNCSTNVTAQASSSGSSFAFNLSRLPSTGDLAVAILPTSPTDRVVFAQPASTSLAVQPGGASSTGTAFQPSASSAPVASSAPSGASSSGAQPSSSASQGGATALPGVSAAPSSSSPAIAGTPASGNGAPANSSSAPSSSGAATSFVPASSGSDNAKPLAVALIIVAFIVGATTWLAAGRAAARAALKEQQPA